MRVLVELVLLCPVPRSVLVILMGSHSAVKEQIPSLNWTGHPTLLSVETAVVALWLQRAVRWMVCEVSWH